MSRYRRTATAAIRVISRPFLLFLVGAIAPLSHAAPRDDRNLKRQTLRAFFDELGGDRMLRARFARSPRGVLGERGLDFPGHVLPERLAEGEIDRLLKQWPLIICASPSTQGVEPQAQIIVEVGDVVGVQSVPGLPVPAYGLPPGPNRRNDSGRAPQRAPNTEPESPEDRVPPSAASPPTDRE